MPVLANHCYVKPFQLIRNERELARKPVACPSSRTQSTLVRSTYARRSAFASSQLRQIKRQSRLGKWGSGIGATDAVPSAA